MRQPEPFFVVLRADSPKELQGLLNEETTAQALEGWRYERMSIVTTPGGCVTAVLEFSNPEDKV